jgi:hypothetical protein
VLKSATATFWAHTDGFDDLGAEEARNVSVLVAIGVKGNLSARAQHHASHLAALVSSALFSHGQESYQNPVAAPRALHLTPRFFMHLIQEQSACGCIIRGLFLLH